MGYAEVRAAVVEFFQDAIDAEEPKLTGVRWVYRDAPWWVDGASIPFIVDVGPDETEPRLWGAAMFVHFDRSTESRIGVPAPNIEQGRTIDSGFVGQKNVTYLCTIGVLYQYLIPAEYPDDPTGKPPGDQWASGVDTIIDELKALIHADPNLGHPDVIFQAGQANAGLTLDWDAPTQNGGVVNSWLGLQLTIEEIITA